MTERLPDATPSSLAIDHWRTRSLSLGAAPEPGRLRILGLHGWGDSAECFLRLFARLADLDAALIALDFPGFGTAQPLGDGPQLPQFVAFARAAIVHFAADGPLLVVGQSLGGRAALMALHEQPVATVRGLVAVGPAPLKLPGWQQVLVRNRSLAPGVSQIARADDARVVAEVVQSHRRTCFHAPDRVPKQVFDDYARYVTPARAHQHIERLRQFGAEIGQPLALSGVACPVALVWGAQDRISPLSAAADYRAALPHASLTVIEACGHHAHLEQPDAVADVVRGMLAE